MPEDLRKERLRKPISKEELERRWKAVRKAMEKENLDCLIMQNNNQYLGGYVRYFTDIPAQYSYPITVIFPLHDDMTMIAHGGTPLPTIPPDWATHGVKERINLPYLLTLNFTNTMDAKAAVDTLKKLKIKSLGLVARAFIPATLSDYIRENLSGVTFTDATDLVDEIKAIKSEEEIKLIKNTVEMHDIVFGAALAMIRPGVREYELRSEIHRLNTNWGSEEQLIAIGSAPAGVPAGQLPSFFQNRTLQYGDSVCIMIEVNGAGGFYGELGRTVCLGEAPKPLLKLWADMVGLQDQTAELLKPGAKPSELIAIHNKSLAKMGYPQDGRLYAHGQGYDLVERPGIRPEETMTIKADMNIAVHPMTVTKEAYAFCCDNYIVTDSGAVRIHRTPREVFVV